MNSKRSYLFHCLLVTAVATLLAPAPASPRAFVFSGPVKVHGNRAVQSYIIEREIPFRPGDAFDVEAFKDARTRIRTLPGVDHANIDPVFVGEDSTVAIAIYITEKPAIEGKFRFERGYEDKLSWGLTMTHENFRGRNERLKGSFLLRGNQVYEGEWQNPWVATRYRIGAGLRGFYKDYDYVYADAGPALVGAGIVRYGGELAVFYSRGGASRAFGAVGFERVEGRIAGVTLEPDGDNTVIVSLGAVLDGRDSPRFPWLGGYLEVVGRQIGPGQEAFHIFEGTIDARGFVPVLDRVVVAGQSALTYRDADRIPLYRRAHIGGSGTLRGYDYGSFHGDNSWVNSAELRIPVNFSREDPVEDALLGLAVHVFADAAAAWDRGDDVDADSFHAGYGVGMTLLNKNIPGLRLDYGRHSGSSEGHWEFDVGLKF